MQIEGCLRFDALQVGFWIKSYLRKKNPEVVTTFVKLKYVIK